MRTCSTITEAQRERLVELFEEGLGLNGQTRFTQEFRTPTLLQPVDQHWILPVGCAHRVWVLQGETSMCCPGLARRYRPMTHTPSAHFHFRRSNPGGYAHGAATGSIGRTWGSGSRRPQIYWLDNPLAVASFGGYDATTDQGHSGVFLTAPDIASPWHRLSTYARGHDR